MYLKFLKSVNNHNGFTLIEIFITVIVLGILVAVAVPAFTITLNKKRAEDCNNQKMMITNAAQQVMAGMIDNGKEQSVILINTSHPVASSHLYKSEYLLVSNCTIGDIRGGYRASDKVSVSDTVNSYENGCKNGYYLKKLDLKDKPLYTYFSNEELPRCPFDKDGVSHSFYYLDKNGTCYCSICDASE